MAKTSQRRNVLITAGPTREYLDPVRYLSNDSSGQMGYALAKAAVELGSEVTLISGPVSLSSPRRVTRVEVISAREMHRACLQHAQDADLIIMCAAVSDWRPLRMRGEKIKKERASPTLRLTKNPDILADLGRRKREHQLLVGFALETRELEKNARTKLKQKNCDWIVANAAKSIGATESKAILISAHGKRITLPKLPKEDLAVLILSHLLV